jgi:hypothetical protein
VALDAGDDVGSIHLTKKRQVVLGVAESGRHPRLP